jgi:hypothetical protein
MNIYFGPIATHREGRLLPLAASQGVYETRGVHGARQAIRVDQYILGAAA